METSYRHDVNNKTKCTTENEHSCNNLGCDCSEGAVCCHVVLLTTKEE